jgi:uncharacterized membrane protein (Fun14 family)
VFLLLVGIFRLVIVTYRLMGRISFNRHASCLLVESGFVAEGFDDLA